MRQIAGERTSEKKRRTPTHQCVFSKKYVFYYVSTWCARSFHSQLCECCTRVLELATSATRCCASYGGVELIVVCTLDMCRHYSTPTLCDSESAQEIAQNRAVMDWRIRSLETEVRLGLLFRIDDFFRWPTDQMFGNC